MGEPTNAPWGRVPLSRATDEENETQRDGEVHAQALAGGSVTATDFRFMNKMTSSGVTEHL